MDCNFLCEKKLAAESPELHRIFKDSVLVLQKILTSYQSIFPSYTDHSSLHSMQVADFCNHLIAENINELSATECFVLLMSCYFHDTGMGIPENELDEYFDSLGLATEDSIDMIKENIRKNHNEFSSLFVKKKSNFFDFPNEAISTAVAEVARGHRKVDLYDEINYPSEIDAGAFGKIRLPYLASLIRLADEIDIAADRIPLLLVDYELVALDKKCVREHEKHRAIRHLIINKENLVMQVQTDDESLFEEIQELRDKVKETLDYCRMVVSERTPFNLTQSDILIDRI